MKTENSQSNELFRENKFYVEGEGNIKYTYNFGNIANDPKLAVNYFLNALEKIPSLIENYQTGIEKLEKDLPVLQKIVNSTWRKESELKDLKTELAAVDRKIQLSLKPIDESEDRTNQTQEARIDRLQPEKNETQLPKPVEERLQQAKETMGDRLVIASIPKYHNENQPKGIKI